MYGAESARQRVKDRGPRFAVMGTIRQGEAEAAYADTAERAEEIKERFEADGRYSVRIYPPQEFDDTVQVLSGLQRERENAKAALDDATSKLRAAIVRLVQQGALSESEAARRAGVDRMTIRNWLGKR